MLHPNQVYSYYFSQQNDLLDYTFFHFFSRSWLVANRHDAKDVLDQRIGQLLQDTSTQDQLRVLSPYLTNHLLPPQQDRQDYLLKYPDLRPFARDAFSVLFGQEMWNLTLKEELKKKWNRESVASITQKLLSDEQAMLILATYALNYLSLYSYFYQSEAEYDSLVMRMYALVESAWERRVSSTAGLQSTAYFITHLVINDSLFYTRPIPEQRHSLHLNYLTRIYEVVLNNGLNAVSHDCLCELQVAFQLFQKTAPRSHEVMEIVGSARSVKGDYVVEPSKQDVDFNQFEHLNVLYFLAFRNESWSSNTA